MTTARNRPRWSVFATDGMLPIAAGRPSFTWENVNREQPFAGRFPLAIQTGFSPERVDSAWLIRRMRSADEIAASPSFPRRERTYQSKVEHTFHTPARLATRYFRAECLIQGKGSFRKVIWLERLG